MKECRRCHKTKPLDAFGKDRRNSDGLCRYCLVCRSEETRKQYYANGSTYKHKSNQRSRDVIRRNRIKIYEYLVTKCCVDCGEKDIVVLDFDHRDEKDKQIEISKLSRIPLKWETIQREIDKCDIRCANCHRRKTAKQFGYHKLLEEVLVSSNA